MTDSFFKNRREFELVSAEFDRRERAEIDRVLNRAGDREIRAMLRIQELETLRDSDIDTYHRQGGSDELLALLTGDENQ